MLDVYWFEQTEADVPVEDDWLHPHEAVRLRAMRFPKRRGDWRLGRWTAKYALAACRNLRHPEELEISAAPSGAPEVLIGNKPADVTISLSHRGGRAVCAVARAGASLGCDLELIEPHSDAFLQDYFTPEEQQVFAHAPIQSRPRISTLFWSAKESALKALQQGLRWDTRTLAVTTGDGPGPWQALSVHCDEGQIFRGWWQASDLWIRTLVAAPRPTLPASPLGLPELTGKRTV